MHSRLPRSGILLVIVLLAGWLRAVVPTQAASRDFTLKIFSSSGEDEGKNIPLDIFPDAEEVFLAVGKVMGGAGDEIVVGAGSQSAPEVVVMASGGAILSRFAAYGNDFKGGVRLSVCDLNNDGIDEIITGAGPGGGPHVRVFNASGTPVVNNGFFAFEPGYSGGVEVACGDVDGNKVPEIVVARDMRAQPEVRVFTREGKYAEKKFVASGFNTFMGVSLAVVDFYGDSRAEIVLSGGYGSAPAVKIFDDLGHEINKFNVYGKNFFGGVNIAAYQDAQYRYLLTAPGITGGPHVKMFDLYGNLKREFFSYGADMNGGVKLASGNLDSDPETELVTVEQAFPATDRVDSRFIEVDLSEQAARAHDSGYLVNEFLISSGKKNFETPQGEFSVWRKRPKVTMSWYYGAGNPNNYRLPDVPWTLSFKGPYTLHGTYWHHNFGHPMSHGCVNMYTPDAKWLYDWAPVGTPVWVHE